MAFVEVFLSSLAALGNNTKDASVLSVFISYRGSFPRTSTGLFENSPEV